MSEEESDSEFQRRRKRRTRYAEDDSPGASSSNSGPMSSTSSGRRGGRQARRIQDDSDSDSGSSIDQQPKRKCVPRVLSGSDSDSSDSMVIATRSKRPARVVSESENDSDRGFEGSSTSQWETDVSDSEAPKSDRPMTAKVQDTGVDSDSSDGQSEKCPICLLSLKTQEIGTPESCDHMFCADCIQEWSKNMNTCPVDRQEYRLILVRRDVSGQVYRKVPIEPPSPQNEAEIVEDPTFCEVCGSSEREDRMLLCDGCDMGFHLDCLVPPLEHVPVGAWFCGDCSPSNPEDVISREIEMYEVQLLLDDAEEIGRPFRLRRRIAFPTPRLIPRTRQSERVRSRIQNNRAQTTEAVTSTSTQQTRRKKKKRAKKRKPKYRVVYEVDPSTGETTAVKKLIRRRRKVKRKKKRNLQERTARTKSVKKRLALQLGMCRPPPGVPQATPEMKVPPNGSSGSGTISSQRFKAAIPALHLFGRRDELDYFSPSDDDDDDDYNEVGGTGGSSVLVRRPPNRSDVAVLRRRAQAKSVVVPTNSVSSTSDLLGDILNAQERFHSRSTVFALDPNGAFTMKPTTKTRLGDFDGSVRKNHGSSSGSGSNNSDSVPTSSGGGDHYQPPSSAAPRSPEGGSTAPTSTVEGNLPIAESLGGGDRYEGPGAYSHNESANDPQKKDARSPSPESESEIDIYSDIETVSTSKADEGDFRPNDTPPPTAHAAAPTPDTATTDGDDSEPDMVIDTDKPPADSEENTKEEAAVTSTVDVGAVEETPPVSSSVHSTSELQSQAVQSSNEDFIATPPPEEEDDSEDECPNFSIYSKESITMAQNTDCSLNPADENPESNGDQVGEVSSSPSVKPVEETAVTCQNVTAVTCQNVTAVSCQNLTVRRAVRSSGLYSDSEDESVVKKKTSFAIGDIRNMTEDISEEERSYTPCLDERGPGLEGLDTEMISDEDRNDFDESHDLKTASDGDALEINAKESEMDLTRPEDYEEGEIVDKSKANSAETKPCKEEFDEEEEEVQEEAREEKLEPVKKEEIIEDAKPVKPAKKSKEPDSKSSYNKENEEKVKETSFKKLSKSTKERNYRDKDKEKEKERSRSRDRRKSRSKERRKERRKEIQRYNVRAVIAVKPRRLKDKFGRDIIRPSESRSKSASPVKSPPNRRKSRSPSKSRKGKRGKRSATESKSPERAKRSRSRGKKRKRSKSREKRRKSRERSTPRMKKARSRSRARTRSPVSPAPAAKRRKEWRRQSREWTASPSRSRSREPEPRHFTPSWTPPRMLDNNAVQPRNLTVILTNDPSSNKKKAKEKKKKGEKKAKENDRQKKRKRNERTPPPSKEVFASGDNILVSVSFNKDNETRDVSTGKRKANRDKEDGLSQAVAPVRKKKEKRAKAVAVATTSGGALKKPPRDLTGVKPVAIIDLERSPFKELTPSPKDVIVLSDSDTEESRQKICDSSQQVGSPERTGPKTPPEPQIKFTLTSKPPQLRAISNPLHDPLDVEVEENDTQEVDGVHIGPNTPPEPPNSPPSSPDAYDPFEPTKSRSPTPETSQNNSSTGATSAKDDGKRPEDTAAAAEVVRAEIGEKSSVGQTPETLKSHTPPLADVQPADSQSSTHASPESDGGKSPERATPLSQSSGFSGSVSKPPPQTVPFSSVPTSIISSTPVISNLATSSRIGLLNSTLIAPLAVSSMPRIVLPATVKSSPVKISPSKQPVVKSAPAKVTAASLKTGRKSGGGRTQNGAESSGENLMLDSPYSPGSSDYEDLFEPPAESPAKSSGVAAKSGVKGAAKSPTKIQNAFDTLFGSPFNKNAKKAPEKTGGNNNSNKFGSKKVATQPATGGSKGKGSKQVGVKVDEDSLKILDELPNSAVEMQVKDKFLKKLNRQERVVEEVKLVLKPHYNKKHINKDEYKDILRRAVPKICHNKSGEINPTKIKNLIEAYVKKIRHSKKVTSSSSVNPQKV